MLEAQASQTAALDYRGPTRPTFSRKGAAGFAGTLTGGGTPGTKGDLTIYSQGTDWGHFVSGRGEEREKALERHILHTGKEIWGSLEKRLHLLPARHGLVIGCQNVSAARDGSSQCAFPTAAELHTLAWCKMLLPQNDHTSLSPPRVWDGDRQEAAVASRSLLPLWGSTHSIM